jgi:hypothetical protein
MSWSVTVDNLQDIRELPEAVYDKLSKDNPLYLTDATGAFRLAKDAGLVSVTLAGGRTPNPYGGAEVVVISITGFDSDKIGRAVPKDFMQKMRETVMAPDEDDEFPDTTW